MTFADSSTPDNIIAWIAWKIGKKINKFFNKIYFNELRQNRDGKKSKSKRKVAFSKPISEERQRESSNTFRGSRFKINCNEKIDMLKLKLLIKYKSSRNIFDKNSKSSSEIELQEKIAVLKFELLESEIQEKVLFTELPDSNIVDRLKNTDISRSEEVFLGSSPEYDQDETSRLHSWLNR